MTQPRSRLTPLQAGLLEAFFRHEDRFYLTGGGALVGYHLGHRETHDLDLFALTPIMDDGVQALRQAARDVGASWRVDPVEEIFANKLCALLGRAEIRDLIDVRALEGRGLSLENALAAGERKDGGLTPAQLAYVLSQITIGDDAELPGGVPPTALREYLDGLVDRLARLARP